MLTRDYKETIIARAVKDQEFHEGLLHEAIECMLQGDTETGKQILQDHLDATKALRKLAKVDIDPIS